MSVAQDGIQKLLAAEQEAQQIVAKARKGQCMCCMLSGRHVTPQLLLL